MDKLRRYLNSMKRVEQQAAFARRCNTTIAYLRKCVYSGQQLGLDLAMQIEIVSCGEVRVEDIRPDGEHLLCRLLAAREHSDAQR